jgi:hypothetical protein
MPARRVNRAMPGWDSLESVARLHDGVQVAGLVLLALLVALLASVALQLRKGVWPEWLDVGAYQFRSRFLAMACGAVLVLLLGSELAAYGYGVRRQSLQGAAEQVSAEKLRRATAELQTRRADGTPQRMLKENSELRQKLIAAENRLAELERSVSQKRLSQEQKRLLVESLRPFAGQKVSIASIQGDTDGQVLAKDFVAVFEAAGWDHGGEAGLTTQQWDRDPVGIEVMLNDSDARGGRINAGLGALINAVRKLGLVYDNTVYMSDEVPSGEAQLRVGKKLKR